MSESAASDSLVRAVAETAEWAMAMALAGWPAAFAQVDSDLSSASVIAAPGRA